MQLTYVRIAVFRGYPLRVYERFRRFFGEFFHIHNFALLAVFCRAPCRMFYDFRSSSFVFVRLSAARASNFIFH